LFSHRILQNFAGVNGQSTSIRDVMETHRKATPDKENCLAHFEILSILKKIFLKKKDSRIRTSEGRKKVYLNLATSSCFTSDNSVSDFLTWLNLKAYKPKFDFHWEYQDLNMLSLSV